MIYKPISLALLAVAVLSLGPAIAQTTCDYTLDPETVAAGTQIVVTAPAVWDERSLTYAWDVVDTTTGLPVTLYGESGDTTATYTFLAPDTGSYKITLTVSDSDTEYATSCMDERCMDFLTTSSFTCPMQDVTFCEVDWGTALPTTITYGGALVPGRALQWLIDGVIVQEDLASVSGMATLTPDWADTDGSGTEDPTGIFDVSLGLPPTTPGGINVGEVHTITLKVYKQPFTKENGHYTGTLEYECTATYTSVADPLEHAQYRVE